MGKTKTQSKAGTTSKSGAGNSSNRNSIVRRQEEQKRANMRKASQNQQAKRESDAGDVKVEIHGYCESVRQIDKACRELIPISWRHQRWFTDPYGCFKNPVVPDYVKASDALEVTIERLQKAVDQTVSTMKKVGESYVEIDEKATTALKG